MVKKAKHGKSSYAILLGAVVLVAFFFFAYSGPSNPLFITITIMYTDGSSQTYRADNAPKIVFRDVPLSHGALSFIDSTGKTVQSITLTLHFAAVYSNGTATSWAATGATAFSLHDGATRNLLMDFGETPISASGGPITSGENVALANQTIDQATLQSMYLGWEEKTYYFVASVTQAIQLTLTFTDGSSQTQSATATDFWWQFSYQHPPEIGVYNDGSATLPTSSVDWGVLSPGSTVTRDIYIKNMGTWAFSSLSLSASSWVPTNADQYLTFSWSYPDSEMAKMPLQPGAVIRVRLSLFANSTVQGITNFSFSITITAFQ